MSPGASLSTKARMGRDGATGASPAHGGGQRANPRRKLGAKLLGSLGLVIGNLPKLPSSMWCMELSLSPLP